MSQEIMFKDIIQIDLNLNNALDKYLLIPLEKVNLGLEPDIDTQNFSVRLGSKPVCINLIDYYLKQNQKIPKELNVFDHYDIWLVNFGVSILKTGGWQKINQLGLEISYPSELDDVSVTVISNMPTTSFKPILGGKLIFKAGVELNGQLNSKIKKLKVENLVDLGYNGKLSISNKSNTFFEIQMNLVSSKVISTGVGDNHAEWIIYRDQEPLLGDQLFSQTILTPKDLEMLKVKARINCVITGQMGLFPIKLVGDWNELVLFNLGEDGRHIE